MFGQRSMYWRVVGWKFDHVWSSSVVIELLYMFFVKFCIFCHLPFILLCCFCLFSIVLMLYMNRKLEMGIRDVFHLLTTFFEKDLLCSFSYNMIHEQYGTKCLILKSPILKFSRMGIPYLAGSHQIVYWFSQ